MSGEDPPAGFTLLPPEEWSPSENALRESVLRTISLLREVSGESASLQEWVEYRMADEVRFIKNARRNVVLEQIETSTSASGPTAALKDSYLGQEQGTNNEQAGPQYVWPQMAPPYDYYWPGAADDFNVASNMMMMQCWWAAGGPSVDPVGPCASAVGIGSGIKESAKDVDKWLSQNTTLCLRPDDRADRLGKLRQTWMKTANAPADTPIPVELFDEILRNALALASQEASNKSDKAPRLGSQAIQKVLVISTPLQKEQIIRQLATSAPMLLYHDSGCFVVSQLLEEGECC